MAERREFYKADPNTVFRSLVRIARERSSNSVVDDENKIITFGTSPSLLSYGERVEINVNVYEGRTAVLVQSLPHVFFNITGEDRAQRNVDEIHEALGEEFSV